MLKAYIYYGRECVNRFNGMFAIAIWDPGSAEVYLLRDRLGIKPLYYLLSNNQLFFASEVKAIKLALKQRLPINVSLIDHYMSFGYIPGEDTLLQGINRLPPGFSALYSVNAHCLSQTRYWDLPSYTEQDRGEDYYLERGKELINSAIDLRLRSDVPLGIFLSGGIDSSAVVGLLAERTNEPLKTYSVAYDFGKDFNETPYARRVAQRFKTDHHELFVKPEDFRDFIPQYVHLMDEPVAEAAAISLYFLAKMTKEDVTVVLSGEGSDEVFAGYDLYRYMVAIERYRRLVTPLGAGLIGRLGKIPVVSSSKLAKYFRMSRQTLAQRYKGISTYEDYIKGALYQRGFKNLIRTCPIWQHVCDYLQSLFRHHTGNALSQMLYFDTKTWLADDLLIKADRMSMAASLELRVPFLDYRLVEFAARMPNHYKIRNGQGKYLLKQMVVGLLPDEIIYRKKMGFPTPLKMMMFQGPMREYSAVLLTNPNAKILEFFHLHTIKRILAEHQAGQVDHHRRLWQLVVLEEWLQQNG